MLSTAYKLQQTKSQIQKAREKLRNASSTTTNPLKPKDELRTLFVSTNNMLSALSDVSRKRANAERLLARQMEEEDFMNEVYLKYYYDSGEIGNIPNGEVSHGNTETFNTPLEEPSEATTMHGAAEFGSMLDRNYTKTINVMNSTTSKEYVPGYVLKEVVEEQEKLVEKLNQLGSVLKNREEILDSTQRGIESDNLYTADENDSTNCSMKLENLVNRSSNMVNLSKDEIQESVNLYKTSSSCNIMDTQWNHDGTEERFLMTKTVEDQGIVTNNLFEKKNSNKSGGGPHDPFKTSSPCNVMEALDNFPEKVPHLSEKVEDEISSVENPISRNISNYEASMTSCSMSLGSTTLEFNNFRKLLAKSRNSPWTQEPQQTKTKSSLTKNQEDPNLSRNLITLRNRKKICILQMQKSTLELTILVNRIQGTKKSTEIQRLQETIQQGRDKLQIIEEEIRQYSQ